MDLKTVIAHNLKTIRKTRKISQAETAKLLNVKQAAVSAYEIGRISPSNEVLYDYAKTFGVSLDFIFGITSSETGGILKPEFIQSLSVGTQGLYGNPDNPSTPSIEEIRKLIQEEVDKKLEHDDEGD